MKRIFALFLSALLALALAGCGGETTSASVAAPTAAPPASEQSESASQSEAARTWTEEEVLELYEAGREETWELED